MPATVAGPHQSLELLSDRERFLAELLDALWATYRKRVAYVQVYEKLVAQAGARFVNDHIAFRTLANQTPQTGISSVSRIFEALDYRLAGCYHFPDKHLSAIHFQHPNPQFPKLFISELRTWELATESQQAITAALNEHRPALAMETLARLQQVEALSSADQAKLLAEAVKEFHSLPWRLVERQAVEAVNQESQYAAWVLVHGYHVNHFTALVNSHGVPDLDDIEGTSAALARAGVPMKREIEGEPGSALRQTATEAVTIDVDVLEENRQTTMPWTYAYFELAQRDPILDPATGHYSRFEGFLGPQATNLFEMTRKK